MTTEARPATPTPPWPTFTDGQLEFMKWLAVLSMFIDHFGRHLFGWSDESLVFGAGRLAFPLFALVLACNLARPGDQIARAKRTALRLALACAVATPAAIWARGDPAVINIFGTLSLAAALLWILTSKQHHEWRIPFFVLVAIASWYVEFVFIGVVLVAAFAFWQRKPSRSMATLAAVALISLAGFNTLFGGAYGLLGTFAVLPVVWAVRYLPIIIPRMPWLFYAIYPVHLALIGALKTFTG